LPDKKNKIQYTAKIYSKHSEVIYKNTQFKVILILNYMLPNNRNRIIEKRINFLIPNKQFYLPDLFINLNNYKFKKEKTVIKFSPVAQFLILYHLQKSSIENKSYKVIKRFQMKQDFLKCQSAEQLMN